MSYIAFWEKLLHTCGRKSVFIAKDVSQSANFCKKIKKNSRDRWRRFDEVETPPERPVRSFRTQNLTHNTIKSFKCPKND